MEIGVPVERFEDMSTRGKLSILVQEDGDIIVSVIPDSLEEFNRRGLFQYAEFCTIGVGGGQSPRTLEALRNLIEAMEADNRKNPQFRK